MNERFVCAWNNYRRVAFRMQPNKNCNTQGSSKQVTFLLMSKFVAITRWKDKNGD